MENSEPVTLDERINNMKEDDFFIDIKEATNKLLDAFGGSHPFVQENLLRQLCYTTEKQVDWLGGKMQEVVKQMQDRWENSAQQEIDTTARNRQLEYFEQLGEDKVINMLLHSLWKQFFNDHADATNRPKYGTSKKAPARSNQNDRDYVEALCAHFGVETEAAKAEKAEEHEAWLRHCDVAEMKGKIPEGAGPPETWEKVTASE
jgi:hypothetical protein